MQCCLNGVHFNEVPKFLNDSTKETNHTIQVSDPLDAAHPIILQMQLKGVTNHFKLYLPSIAEFEEEDNPHFHLKEKVQPWYPLTSEFSVRYARTIDHQGEVILLAKVARGPVFISAFTLYSLPCSCPNKALFLSIENFTSQDK